MTESLIRVRLGPPPRAGYDVVVGAGALERLPERLDEVVGAARYAVISDSTVAPLHGERISTELAGAGLQTDLFTFPAGEASKNRDWWGRLTDALLAEGIGRDGAVVAVGGGVTGDLAGFVAATYMRGVPVVQVPTSLVAMIDSGVGGKTGVDHPHGKNLVGAFHAPALVVADPLVVRTLPRSERAQGLAEAVKHGAIRDALYLDELDRAAATLLEGDPSAVEKAVRRSVEIKAEVVGEDEREAGLRQVLNFGHTLGHALEAASGYTLPHGSAVAIGMVLEARLGERLGTTSPGTTGRITRVLERLELPTEPTGPLAASRVARFLTRDKKVRRGRPGIVLLRHVGEVDPGEGWVHRVGEEDVERLLDQVEG